jgi:nitroreductase
MEPSSRIDVPPADWAGSLVEARQTVLPKRLAEPGPDQAQLRQILEAAAHAPDHDRQVPWRFVIVPSARRADLGDAFARALRERDPLATAGQVEQAREKAFRAPLLMLAVVRFDPHSDIPAEERILSTGCAIQNMLLVTTAQGFGSALTSGKAMRSPALRELFALGEHEQALCFVSIGTAATRKPRPARPSTADYVTVLGSG